MSQNDKKLVVDLDKIIFQEIWKTQKCLKWFKFIANFDLIIKKSDFKGLRPRGNIEQLYSETVFTAPGENTSRGETKTEREITSKPPPVYG